MIRKKSLKVGAADEVAEMNTLHRAHIVAYATTRTLIIINYGKIILNLDSAVRTGLLALAAADTAVKADLANLGALIVA